MSFNKESVIGYKNGFGRCDIQNRITPNRASHDTSGESMR